jgi:hypothetical protein
MMYTSEDELLNIIRSFEDATIARGVWRHAEHLVVALYYLQTNDRETAYRKMKDGIFNLLRKGFGLDLSKEMPYHETLTVFWLDTVAGFLADSPELSHLQKANRLVERFDKDYPLRFYSRERLFSPEAREVFVEPDLT